MKLHEVRNYQDLVRICPTGESAEFVFFWGHTPKKGRAVGKECFSQWYPSPFQVDRIDYPTVEHYMMVGKATLFGDLEARDEILATPDPGTAKAIGRRVRNFAQDRWEAEAFEIVVQGNLAKFSQNDALKDFLLNTGTRILVEASPHDKIWGIGLSERDPRADQPMRWKGTNLLGFALMEVRAQLAAANGEGAA